MDCNHARLLLEVAHPVATELEAPERKALAAHLADCPECGTWAEAERRADEKIGAAVRDVTVPEGLKQGIVRRLNAERDAFYRRWLVRAAGVAAALLLTVWVGYAAWFGRKPAPELELFAQQVDLPVGAPEGKAFGPGYALDDRNPPLRHGRLDGGTARSWARTSGSPVASRRKASASASLPTDAAGRSGTEVRASPHRTRAGPTSTREVTPPACMAVSVSKKRTDDVIAATSRVLISAGLVCGCASTHE